MMCYQAVREYGARDNPDAASGVAKRIREAVRILADHPAAGRPGRVPLTREIIVSGTPYILPYRLRAGAVEILRVLHAAQEWPGW